MKLTYVTLTGADDKTSIKELSSFSRDYPFAEWGILFSQNKSGSAPRYPGWDWASKLIGEASDGAYAAHLCGKWVDDAMKGELTFVNSGKIETFFSRIQLNMAKDRLLTATKSDCPVWQAIEKVDNNIDILFGGPYQKYNIKIDVELFSEHRAFPMFDTSGGRGILTKEWPEHPGIFCGYSGGLGPDNIADELKRIEQVVGDKTIWIDMETKLRNKSDKFDLDLCKRVCEIAGAYW